MSTQDALFDGYEPLPAQEDTRGHDARRTAAQRALIAAGIHPATRRPTAPERGTCGDCAHLLVKRYDKTYFKCARQLHDGVGLDIRKHWPACVEHTSLDGS